MVDFYSYNRQTVRQAKSKRKEWNVCWNFPQTRWNLIFDILPWHISRLLAIKKSPSQTEKVLQAKLKFKRIIIPFYSIYLFLLVFKINSARIFPPRNGRWWEVFVGRFRSRLWSTTNKLYWGTSWTENEMNQLHTFYKVFLLPIASHRTGPTWGKTIFTAL